MDMYEYIYSLNDSDIKKIEAEIAEIEADSAALKYKIRNDLDVDGNPASDKWDDVVMYDYIKDNDMKIEHLKFVIAENKASKPIEDVNDYGMPNNIDLNDVPKGW